MKKCEKDCDSCDCKNRPKMLVALVVGLAVLVLTPSVGGSLSHNVMSSVIQKELPAKVLEVREINEDYTKNLLNKIMGSWK
ncbi:hypothetical protein HOG17_04085 [Candidatus Peregrinibacteria bacterium]|jgi:hypothetical protein|nr:hypothetical protein [Candidatus Peregrinibacteria bacterium]MBT4148008.1 hypothetical protein [Candidatus Peregrinibacteria bacterium]MBT4366747.1 hypothetical protein [Candidatus Peregrinibacteria bacterium]MBT4456326.1 hypothetical protein [Candidatus Peregrinibacteria bacterium]